MPVVTYRRRGGGSNVDLDSSALLSALHRLTEAGSDVAAETTPVLAEILNYAKAELKHDFSAGFTCSKCRIPKDEVRPRPALVLAPPVVVTAEGPVPATVAAAALAPSSDVPLQ